VVPRWLTFLVVLTITPCASEIVETVAHAVSDGDYVHAENSHHRSGPGAEHGCTPLFHSCGCHGSSLTVISTAAPRGSNRLPLCRAALAGPPDRAHGRGSEPPPLPPPIA
jgi:hypothetical protein